MRTEARFPALGRDAGHYESFYLKLTHPDGGRGVWIRETIHKRPGAEPTASIWFTLFDADAPAPRAAKATHPAAALSVPPGAHVDIAGSVIEPGRAHGSIETDALTASWDLDFADPSPPLRHLPYGFLYRTPLPRTKFLSPYPSARFDGSVTVAGQEIAIEGWPGMVGHNWGAEHAERWVWLQAPLADHGPGSYLDVAAGRILIAGRLTPWVANGVLRLDGSEHRLGGFDRIRSTSIAERATSCEFALAGRGVRLSGTVGADPSRFVAWVYADPEGPEHNTLNCSIADMEIEVERSGRGPERLTAGGVAAYEIGMRETDHGVPVQPYPDG